jgi:drug/metabolite transporter (DMT)-like permease
VSPSAKSPWPALLLGVLAISTGSILVKLCAVPALSLAAYRLGLAAPFFCLSTTAREPGWWRRFPGEQRPWAVLSGLLLGLHFATWIASLSYTTVTSSVVLVTTNPLFVGLGSGIFLKEKVSPRLWLGMLLALAGTLVIAGFSPLDLRSAPYPLLGNGLALLGALCMSGYLLVGRRLRGAVSTAAYVSAVYSIAALTLLLFALGYGSPMAGFRPWDWGMLALMALIPQGIGHTMLNRSLRVLPASVVALAILGEPVGASLLAAALLDEIPNAGQLGGAVVVLLGVVLGRGSDAKGG